MGKIKPKTEKFKLCPFCVSGHQKQNRIEKLVEIIKTIVKYQDDTLFLTNFILGDWTNQPIEVKELIKKLKLTKHNKI